MKFPLYIILGVCDKHENAQTNKIGMKRRLFFLTLLLPAFVFSNEWLKLPKNQIYVGPEIYHVHRTRAGGTYQNGNSYGVRTGYDRIKRNGWYLGADVLYSSAQLKGESGSGNAIASCLQDFSAEARFGYTFMEKSWKRTQFTPYLGYGYFKETNTFKNPSPVKVKMRTTYDYVSMGFLSKRYVTPFFSLGVNFKGKFPWDTKCKTSRDPDFDNSTQHIKDEFQWRVELPISYDWWLSCNDVLVGSVVPFYEFRHYGAQPNFPFDFYDTKLRCCGATLKVIYCF